MYDYLTTGYKRFSKVIVSKPILLVKDGKILDEKTAINYLTKSTGLDEDTIIRSVNELIKSKKLVTAQDRQNRLHLRKNKFA